MTEMTAMEALRVRIADAVSDTIHSVYDDSEGQRQYEGIERPAEGNDHLAHQADVSQEHQGQDDHESKNQPGC